MSINSVLEELKHERERLDQAIAALEKLDVEPTPQPAGPAVVAAPAGPKRGHLTEAGRKRLSDLAKQRWAEQRKRESALAKSAKGTSGTGKTKSGKPSRGPRS